MKRSVAAFVLLVFVASPVFAAVPTTGMMKHCMANAMPCHDAAAFSCCTTNPSDPATPATPAATGASAAAQAVPVLHVVAVVVPAEAHGFAAVNPPPPHGYQSGDLLSRLSTLLI